MNAVIYCRVSSRDQVEGTSLESQERSCREYATKHNLTISRVFIEEGESAKFADRTQLLELLSYCKDKKIAVLERMRNNKNENWTDHGGRILLVVEITNFFCVKLARSR